MTRLIQLFVFSFCVFCTSCATVTYPQPFEDEPRARLRVMVRGGMMVFINTGKVDVCELKEGLQLLVDSNYAAIPTKGDSIGVPLTPYSGSRWGELYITAGKPIAIKAAYSSAVQSGNKVATTTCAIPAHKFTPKAGKDYEIMSEQQGGKCSMLVVEIADGKRIPVQTQGYRSGCK